MATKVYYIPNGPKNLQLLFGSVDFTDLEEYYIEVKNTGGDTLATGTKNIISSKCCDGVRLRFLNGLGKIDGLNFNLLTIEHEAKSSVKQNRVTSNRADHGISRYNVKGNDLLTLSNNEYLEEDQEWITEFVDSPLCWMEWKGIQGQLDGYIPVVIEDSKFLKRKFEERYEYELIVQVRLSHERFIIRN